MKTQAVTACDICGGTQFIAHTSGVDYEYATTSVSFNYVTCANCQHLFLHNVPAVEALAVIYPAHYQPYQFETALNPLVRYLRDRVQLSKVQDYKKLIPAHAQVLEIGSGSGILMESLRRFGLESWALTANDFEDSRLLRLKALGIQLKIGNFETLDFAQRYDCIIMNQVIEHLYSPDAVLKKARQILNPGGILLIETPNYASLDHRLFKNKYWGGYHIPRHFNLYNDQTIRLHLEKHGFEIIEQTFLLSPAFWVQSMHHWFADRHLPGANFWVLNNILVTGLATVAELMLRAVWKTSNQRVVARLNKT